MSTLKEQELRFGCAVPRGGGDMNSRGLLCLARARGEIRSGITCSLFLLACGLGVPQLAEAQTVVFEENFDTPAFGGDGAHGFSFAPMLVGAVTPADADGYRCQYSDPDNPDSMSFGRIEADLCFPEDHNEWHVDTQASLPGQIRVFSGDGAMHLGLHLSNALGTTYSTGQVSHATSPLIALGAGGTYSLSFRQIVSFIDDRVVNLSPPGAGPDRGVVQVARFDPATGSRVGAWRTIQATTNNYANTAYSGYFGCSFDPIEDGSDEDDVTTPPGQLPFGPSSTCNDGMGRKVYTNMGDALSVNPSDVGSAPDGGGALGNLGPGVWVESEFSLNSYAGETIKFRFLFSGMRLGTNLTWEQYLAASGSDFNPNAGDDGWIIDDVRVRASEGACCSDGPNIESECFIATAADCTASGDSAIYLGDGTVCETDLDCVALVVTMESMSAKATPEGVEVHWTTAMEIDTVGFRVLRETASGQRDHEKSPTVVAQWISAEGNNLVGASYLFTDDSHGSMRASQYYVEDVDIYGKVTRHGPIEIDRGVRKAPASRKPLTTPSPRRRRQ